MEAQSSSDQRVEDFFRREPSIRNPEGSPSRHPEEEADLLAGRLGWSACSGDAPPAVPGLWVLSSALFSMGIFRGASSDGLGASWIAPVLRRSHRHPTPFHDWWRSSATPLGEDSLRGGDVVDCAGRGTSGTANRFTRRAHRVILVLSCP